ncbi:MAG: hypothetical protein HDT27_04020 [Subdoligranulum sp.]|nr:hypothetical protein [Subdoligranulum sp.]
MKKAVRITSTALLLVGVLFLYQYILYGDAASALNRPSYYLAQNYWYVFLAGVAILALDLISCFFAWFKKMDIPEDALPNAAGARLKDIRSWVSGTSLDVTQTVATADARAEETEIAPDADETEWAGETGLAEETELAGETELAEETELAGETELAEETELAGEGDL